MRTSFAMLAIVLGSLNCTNKTLTNVSASGEASTEVCSTIAAPLHVTLPHVSATGANAAAIGQALNAIFASQSPPFAPGQTYVIPSLECSNVTETQFGGGGYGCALHLPSNNGPPVAVTLSPPSALAQTLMNALTAAGSTSCDQGHGPGVTAVNMAISPAGIEYDDTSQYVAFSAPNIVVQGADAESVIAAFAGAGINDCDPTRYMFLICNSYGGAPSCGYQWMPLHKVGASAAVPVCSGGSPSLGASIDATPSLAIWQSILKASTDTGFHPLNGTVGQTRVINAKYFAWDGANLTFTLTLDNATPP